MRKTQKWIAVVLCVCFVLVSAFSAVAIVYHAGHECTGEHCEVCLEIAHLQNALKQLGTAVFAAVFTLATACLFTLFVEAARPERAGTLVSLKVQLNS